MLRSVLRALFLLLCVALGNGCMLVSRVGENALAAGVVDYYADYSTIRDGAVYELDGAYYINVEEIGYDRKPMWIGVIMPPMVIMDVFKDPVEETRRRVWLKISPEARAYLCDEPAETDQDLTFYRIDAEAATDMEAATANAVGRRVLRSTEDFRIITEPERRLRRERSVAGYCMIPVAVAGFALDIPATVVMSAFFDFVCGPIFLIAKIF